MIDFRIQIKVYLLLGYSNVIVILVVCVYGCGVNGKTDIATIFVCVLP
jgi:hypothetical protein